ncbi:hypothetical protein [Flavobacterium sp. '19STA2R22 D10 B1']|uniref:hypothetical protein n=1 Tax=Flavobacterium aerium TaxID=3037261 RepID=UPI00278BFF3F|nr:hypothetical protein [Flavobacterium sp. '19STA2R22 D10 B1']
MKNIIISSFVLLFIFCFSMHNLKAQSKTDVEDVFKMQLFLNKRNIIFTRGDNSAIKNDSLYKSFKNLISLKIDTLKIDNDIEGLQYDMNYKFYKIKDLNISYNKELVGHENSYISVVCWDPDYCILAINEKTGASYRLTGFDTNDFLSFLSDFKEKYNHQNKKNLKTSTFLNNYKVQDLDFKCMYKGLRSKEMDRNKYPCLRRCNDPMEIS